MNPLLEANRPALLELCREYRLRRLDAFGSVTTDRFDPERSDVDLLVEFEDRPPGQYARDYFSLVDKLEELFGRKVDLVVDSAITNPFLRESVEASRVPLYAA